MKEFLKPVKGRSVLMPGSNRKMKEAGEEVEMTSFFYRRLKAGDVEKVTEDKTEIPSEKNISSAPSSLIESTEKEKEETK